MRFFLIVLLTATTANAFIQSGNAIPSGNSIPDYDMNTDAISGEVRKFGILSSIIETTREFGSDSADAGCKAVAKSVQENPIRNPSIDDVSFQLRTPCSNIEVPVNKTSKLREAPGFDIRKKTVVLVTGWLTYPSKDYVEEMAKAYNCRGGYNFIVANTGGYLTNLYVNSAYLTQILGEYIAIGLQQLGVNAEDIHLIGHSLGAQIVGSAGRHYMKLTGEPIERITGLDPARPCFVGEVAFPRLSRKNAKFVDIIHSNPGDLGTEENIGDVDFYPGGLEVTKPGCWKISLLCSHERAIDYYIESVYPENEKNFMGKQCQDYSELESETCRGSLAPMGFAAKENIHGIYYLDVDGDSPYGLDATKNPLEEFKTCGVCPYTSYDYYA